MTPNLIHSQQRPIHHRPSPQGFALFFSLAITSALGLTVLFLSLPSTLHPPATGKQGITVIHDDVVPDAPRLRDESEYVLDPSSWPFDSPPVVREFRWTIVDADLNPDAVFRPMMLINNQFPGPLVECNEGDTLVIHVDNQASAATAIHFHGLFQNGSNFMDGTVGVTQCPIAPNSTFTYRFDVRRQSGTYWYHAHHAVQAADGLVGALIIHARDELAVQEDLQYETDRILMVQDHYHNSSSDLLRDYLKPGNENDEPVPDNALINGRGLRKCHDFPGWRCDDTNASRTVFRLAAGARHRLRVINVGTFAEFQMQIDEHPFYLTEVDGTDVQPEPFHRLNILPAQRYSIVLETNVTTADAFWFRARMVAHCFTTKNRRLQPELWAVVRYVRPDKMGATDDDDDDDDDPHSKEWPEAIEVICRDLNTSTLRPVKPVEPPPAEDFLVLRANFMTGAWRLSRGFFNDSSWRPNVTHPSLHRFLDGDDDDGTEAKKASSAPTINHAIFDPKSELVMQTTGIRTVDISINNFDDGAHPFHLHGHKLFVLAQSRTGYPPTRDQWPAHHHKPSSSSPPPLLRDTVTVEPYAWVIVRVVLDNPGLWALHCHNAWHAAAGMAMQLLARADVVRGWDVDPSRREMCRLPGVASGSVAESIKSLGLPPVRL
ncbi:hypothetical protein L249_5876 [Ophiocordyceps polyrhachis-furcata BCC 54312]|uniref:Multicopper oxidase n=1 Tax=Ophiocordyceps polyrhachis-furcata BCC 54312 TaxID=1330021 RepID=A0A367L0Z0_9HYPO|nr:hypothetical protein L249_5876 [Ophiocordyceps polyrhachis-furcata BCC 54312]